jgi:alpha-beta hydrolase superfamily lysophospholipase
MREFTITARDGLIISAAAFEPENPRGAVQIIHGLREHKERYYPLAEFLSGIGYAVFISDLRGHGQSVNARYFLGHFESCGELVDDQSAVTACIEQTCPGIPVYMIAHSQGASIARLYLKNNDTRIKKLIMTGAFAPTASSSLIRGICSFSQNRNHANTVTGLIASYVNSPDEKRIFNNYTSALEYSRDPLVHGCRLTNGAIYSMADAACLMKQVPVHKCLNEELRILLAYGAHDPNGRVSPLRRTLNQLNRDGYCHIFTVHYPGVKHAVLHDMYVDEIYKDISMFLSD